MTSPDIDQELERLFSVTRGATQPDAGARQRVRAGLATRLEGSAPTRSRRGRAWRGWGAAVVGVGAVALWLARPSQPVAIQAPAVTNPSPAAPAPTAPGPPTARAAPAVPVPVSAASTPAALPKKPALPVTPSSANPGADSAQELTLVQAMQQALRSGNASQALALAAEHARRFPHGALIEEREGVRAIAQCRLAAQDARGDILAGFLQGFAASPYAARVKAACQ